MTKSKASKKSLKRQVHIFETPEFKENLKHSINKNLEKMYQEGFNLPTHIPLEQLLAPCKKTRGKKGKITRPQNAFILYRKDFQKKIKEEHPWAEFKEISKIAGNKWKNESDQVKNNYILLSTLGGLVHQDLFPNYKYQPRHQKEKDDLEKKNDSLYVQGLNFTQSETILSSPHHIIQIPEQPLIESQYYEPLISSNHSTRDNNNKSSTILNYFNGFQHDNNVLNDHIFINSFNSSETSSNEEIDNLLTTFHANYDIQSTQHSYVPVTTQSTFYSSIINDLPIFSEQISSPILTPYLPTVSIVSTVPTVPTVNTISTPIPENSVDDSLQHYDMEFLNEWADDELMDNLYQR